MSRTSKGPSVFTGTSSRLNSTPDKKAGTSSSRQARARSSVQCGHYTQGEANPPPELRAANTLPSKLTNLTSTLDVSGSGRKKWP